MNATPDTENKSGRTVGKKDNIIQKEFIVGAV